MTALSDLRGELRYKEPMAGHVSWRAGGAADIWFQPADIDDLQDFLAAYEGPILPMGLGSNLLVRDGGWPGAVICLYDTLNELHFEQSTGAVQAGAGVHCATLASQAAKRGLGGATFFGGIPGSVGGALAMNAGAWGGETWEVVQRVDVLTRAGELRSWSRDQLNVSYRHVSAPDPAAIYLRACLQLQAGQDAGQLQSDLKAMVAERREKQPVGQPSCGSVFRNPANDHAARLIEAAGLKGFSIGAAEVSTKHANFILNRGEASAADIESLLGHVQSQIANQFQIELVPEVRIVGVAA